MTNEESLIKPELSIIIPVFIENPLKTKQAQERIESFDILANLYGGIEIIIMDDGSCSEMTDWYLKKFPDMEEGKITRIFTLPRSGDWTQPRARNLGMQVAKGRKILLTDIDHLVPPLTLSMLLTLNLQQRQAIQFQRKNLANGLTINPHPGTILFLNTHLPFFDERFCGNYGCDDTRWWQYHKFDRIISNYYMMVDDEVRYHSLSRDATHNRELLESLTNEEPIVTKFDDVYKKDSSFSNN